MPPKTAKHAQLTRLPTKNEQAGFEQVVRTKAVQTFLRDPKRIFKETGYMLNLMPSEQDKNKEIHFASFGQIKQMQKE
jgi:hypothetical protein